MSKKVSVPIGDGSDKIKTVRSTEGDRIVRWLEALQGHEYLSRKYRFKGDAYYEIRNERFSTEYHNLAAEEERNARELKARFEDKLGPGGNIEVPDPQVLEKVQKEAAGLPDPWREKGGEFDDACFFARYPRWAEFVPKFRLAYERWKSDPRFLREAPKFKPVNPTWAP